MTLNPLSIERREMPAFFESGKDYQEGNRFQD